MSRQCGGGCSWDLMALLYSRSSCIWCLPAFTPLVSAALSHFEMIDASLKFLHRERFHCKLVLLVIVLVFVFVFVCLRRRRVQLFVELLACMCVMATSLRLAPDRVYLCLDHLPCVLFFVCLSSFGVVFCFCTSRRSDSS